MTVAALVVTGAGAGSAHAAIDTNPLDDGASTILLVSGDSAHRAVVQNATERAIADCMAELGFAYEPVTRSDTEPGDPWASINRQFGLADDEFIDQFGYGWPATDDAGKEGGQPLGGPEYIAALFGEDDDDTPTATYEDESTGEVASSPARDGCLGVADAAVFGSAGRRQRYVALDMALQSMAFDAVARAVAEPDTVAALDAWSTCMAASGYSFSSPLEPPDEEWPEPAGQREIDTARADYACKVDTGLFDIFCSHVTRFVSEAAEEHAAELAEWRTLLGSIGRADVA